MVFIGYGHPNDEVQWKKVYWTNGEETRYSVSNIGLVRNDEKGTLVPIRYQDGYGSVRLYHHNKCKYFRIHVLVARAFIPNPENKPQVNHKDGDKHHNYDTNLEWMTGSENVRHAWDTGLHTTNRIPIETVHKICKLIQEDYGSIHTIAQETGVTDKYVSRIVNKKMQRSISDQYDFSNYTKRESGNGENNANSVYTDDQIIEICKLIDEGSNTLRQISKLTNVDYRTVQHVYYGETRTSVSNNFKFRKTDGDYLYEKKKQLVIKICNMIDTGFKDKEIAEALGTTPSLVFHIRYGERWTEVSKDYKFMKRYQ